MSIGRPARRSVATFASSRTRKIATAVSTPKDRAVRPRRLQPQAG